MYTFDMDIKSAISLSSTVKNNMSIEMVIYKRVKKQQLNFSSNILYLITPKGQLHSLLKCNAALSMSGHQ